MSFTLPASVKPYWSDGERFIIHGDCRRIIPSLEAGAFDAVITDPPYGLALENNGRSETNYSIKGDGDLSLAEFVRDWCDQYDLPVAMFFSPYNPFAHWRNVLVWDKGPAVGGGGDIATCWKRTFELIGVANNRPLNGQRDEAIRKHWMSPNFRGDHRAHHMAKPVDLMAYLIGKLTSDGQAILDPFLGSGSSLRAAKDMGRLAVGIEIDEEWCDVSARRMEQGVLAFA